MRGNYQHIQFYQCIQLVFLSMLRSFTVLKLKLQLLFRLPCTPQTYLSFKWLILKKSKPTPNQQHFCRESEVRVFLSRIKYILLFSLANSSFVFLRNTAHNVFIFNLIFQYVKVYDHINIFLSNSACVTEVTKMRVQSSFTVL